MQMPFGSIMAPSYANISQHWHLTRANQIWKEAISQVREILEMLDNSYEEHLSTCCLFRYSDLNHLVNGVLILYTETMQRTLAGLDIRGPEIEGGSLSEMLRVTSQVSSELAGYADMSKDGVKEEIQQLVKQETELKRTFLARISRLRALHVRYVQLQRDDGWCGNYGQLRSMVEDAIQGLDGGRGAGLGAEETRPLLAGSARGSAGERLPRV